MMRRLTPTCCSQSRRPLIKFQFHSSPLFTHFEYNSNVGTASQLFNENVRNTRYFHQSSTLEHARAIHSKKSKTEALQQSITINNEIVAMGKHGRWKEILDLFIEQQQFFSPINYATALNRLGRNRLTRTDDPRFQAFMQSLHSNITQHGLKWFESPRDMANVMHGIAKTRLVKDTTASQIVRLIEEKDNVVWLFENGRPQEIANFIWA